MIHYSVSMEKTSDKRKILTLLMMIDIYNTEYTITLSCDEATQKYVQAIDITNTTSVTDQGLYKYWIEEQGATIIRAPIMAGKAFA